VEKMNFPDITKNGYINATGIDACNIMIFDGAKFAETVSSEALKIYEIDKNLAIEYIRAMSAVSISMENCNATYNQRERTNEQPN
jgi:hypothetical protein